MAFSDLDYGELDDDNTLFDTNESTELQAVKGELGDVFWQLSGLCKVLSFTLEDVAQSNLEKLASRKQRGVIDGNGDNR